jgi:hypothetical protein
MITTILYVSNRPYFIHSHFSLSKANDGSWKVQSTEVRYGVLTSSGYHPDLITTLNQEALAAKGYMQSPNDWKNVEITGYFRVGSFTEANQNGPRHIELVARGGRNTNDIGTIDGLSRQCEATTYHSNTYLDGRVKFEKDLEHTIGYTTGDPEKQHAISPLLGRWIGIKAVFYNLPDGSVRLEQWIDENSNNNWHRVLRFADNGNWGGGQPDCGGTDHTIITWGGPIAIFRWDNINDMDVIDLSVREIQPPSAHTPHILNTTGMAPAIYDKGTHYVTHMRLTPEILKKLNDFEYVLEIMGDYTASDASIGPKHELGDWRKRYQDDSRPKNIS